MTFVRSLPAVLQRLVEILVASVVLVLSSPIQLLVAIIIRLDSPGPALFRQTRVGLDQRPFVFYKMRTLYFDARERWPELYAYRYTPEEVKTLRFKREEDPRITRAGRWLRKSTLDELPNFWNILKGDMAIVGPRPEIPQMLPYYTKEQKLKFTVKPGLTGLAQTNGRGNLSFQETIAWDLEYVRNRSFWLDVRIVLRTALLVTRLAGAF
jgi:lipopolysaccharide/colanic/teichoic acid biosynthesis glycosyltransferase